MRILYFILFIGFSSSCFAQNDSGTAPATDQEETETRSEPAEKKRVKKSERSIASPVLQEVNSEQQFQRNANGFDVDANESAIDELAIPQGEAQTIEVANQFESVKIQASNQRLQRSPTAIQQAEMDDAVLYLENNAPNSFEYNYFNYVSGNYDVSRIDNLRTAEELRPNNTDVHVQMAGYEMISGNKSSAKLYLKKLVESGRLSKSVLSYSEDLLLSVPFNGTLITHGFDDSYGVWYVQNVGDIRTDVTLISLDFMQSDFYRNALKNKGYQMPTGDRINVDFLNKFCQLNATKKIALSMTTPKEYFKPMLSNLYVTGLVFEYRRTTFQNFERNEYLWQSALKKQLIVNANDEKAKNLSANYLPMLLQLRKVYGQQGNVTEVKKIDEALDKIGVQCKKYDQVQKLKNAY